MEEIKNFLLTRAGYYIQRLPFFGCITPKSVFQFLPVTTVKRLPLRCNVGSNHGIGARIVWVIMIIIRIWSQMSSGAKLLRKGVVIVKKWIRWALIGGVISVFCYFS